MTYLIFFQLSNGGLTLTVTVQNRCHLGSRYTDLYYRNVFAYCSYIHGYTYSVQVLC